MQFSMRCQCWWPIPIGHATIAHNREQNHNVCFKAFISRTIFFSSAPDQTKMPTVWLCCLGWPITKRIVNRKLGEIVFVAVISPADTAHTVIAPECEPLRLHAKGCTSHSPRQAAEGKWILLSFSCFACATSARARSVELLLCTVQRCS